MFGLVVELLTGRYVATAFNDRERSEWPPHPARLFSALAAAHFDDPRPEERWALEWLAQQGPPSLSASEAFEREAHTVFVPVNDRADGRMGDKKVPFLDQPERRTRQPRAFPSVTPLEPRIVFVWPAAPAPDDVKAALGRLAARVVRLGHSSSLVSVTVLEDAVEPNWRPDDSGGLRLRSFGPTQLRDLEERFAVHRETEPRVMPAIFQLYSRRAADVAVPGPASVFSDEWLVLRRVGGTALSSVSAVGLARMVRKVILSYAEEPIPEVISGHRPDGTASERTHLAFAPLPFVGSHHADGGLLGVALVLPRDASDRDRRSLFRAVARWESEHRRQDEDIPDLPILLGHAGSVLVARVEDSPRQQTLQSSTWCRASRHWASATPIALDRNPGDLWARDRQRAAQAAAAAAAVVRLACQHIGLPAPVDVTILPSPALVGAEKSRTFGPFPGGDGRLQRVLAHIALEFAEPVTGPVLLGAGRYVGLGLMRPVDHE